MKYDDNIDLIRVTDGPTKLDTNEWYAIMVTDNNVARVNGVLEHGDTRTFFDARKGWLGLECTSDQTIYISRIFDRRHDVYRGDTWVVRVKDPAKCYRLRGLGQL